VYAVHDIRPRQVEDLVTTLELWTAEVVDGQIEILKCGPSGPVEDQNTLV